MSELEVGTTNDELYISNVCADESDTYFAKVIGRIEDIVVEDNFMNLQQRFMEEHWREFDEEEENKLVYMEIFKKYVSVIEKYIEENLVKSIDDFDMRIFERELKKRPNELQGEIFEMLSTFSDFSAFKSMFLDYKAMKEGRSVDFSQDMFVLKYNSVN